MTKVTILCGRIASGKTYYANRIKEKKNAIILSVDELMLKLSDSCLGTMHDDIAGRCELYFYQLAEEIIALDINVVIDFGYWTKNERDYAKAYFKDKNIPVELHYIKRDNTKRLEQLQRRNSDLENAISQETIHRAYIIKDELRKRLDVKFEEPLPDEIDVIWEGDIN